MEITVPDYYSGFHCIGGLCQDSCCTGWEVTLDEEAYDRLLALQGPLGDKARHFLNKGEEKSLKLLPDGDCPFWNEDGLCQLQLELGEEALCRTCRMFPRFEEEFGSLRETGLSFSCPEAARLMLSQKGRPLLLQTKQTPEPVSRPNDLHPYYFDALFSARNIAFQLVYRADFPIELRACLLLDFGRRLQKTQKRNRFKKVEKLSLLFSDAAFLRKRAAQLQKYAVKKGSFSEMARFFKQNLEYMSPDLPNSLSQDMPPQLSPFSLQGEILLSYYLYRYFLKSLYDKNLYGKTALAATAFLMIRFLVSQKKFSEERCFQLYSKEIEHSEDNLLRLETAFTKERIFSFKNLLASLLNP